jgi:hypothetical protein
MTQYSLMPQQQPRLGALQMPPLQQQLGSWGQPDYSLGTQVAPQVGVLQTPSYEGITNFGTAAQAGNGTGFGFNMPTAQLGLGALNSLGSLITGGKSLSLANKQFEAANKFANTNLQNQTKVYNDTLENRLKRIGSFNQTDPAETQAEIARRRLPA